MQPRHLFQLCFALVLLAPSLASAETVTFEVEVPWCTPVGDVVSLRSNRLDPDTWVHDALTRVSTTLWSGTFEIVTSRDAFRYKYSHTLCDASSCVGIEKSLDYTGVGGEVDQRTLPEGADHVRDLVFIWRDSLVHFDSDGRELGLRTDDEDVAFCGPYLSVSSVNGQQITVGYDSFNAGEVTLEWGTTAAYGSRLVRSGSYRNHFVLDGLRSGATYHYRVSEE